VVFQMGLATSYLDVVPGDRSISFLPLCHIAERMASVFNPLAMGLVVHFPESASTVFNDMREVAPHVLFAPPRFWEKLHSQIDLFMRDAIAPARWVYGLARRQSQAFTQAQLQGQAPQASLPLKLLRALAFGHIRVFLGLQNVKSALTGAAPVPPELVRWFMDCGIELREAFGMTETCGFCTATPAGGVRLGVGHLPGQKRAPRRLGRGAQVAGAPHELSRGAVPGLGRLGVLALVPVAVGAHAHAAHCAEGVP
jgi:long-chain acyl-CoA synthetase